MGRVISYLLITHERIKWEECKMKELDIKNNLLG